MPSKLNRAHPFSHSIQQFENLPVRVYAAYKQILITANEPFRAITN